MTSIEAVQHWQLWFALALAVATLTFYALDIWPMQAVSLTSSVVALAFFHFFPVLDSQGSNLLDAQRILGAFANPNLIAIMALLVLGQTLFLAGSLDSLARMFARFVRAQPKISFGAILALATVLSAFMNNTPVVVMFIPLLATVAAYNRVAPSRMMMPLSFVCVLGGMTTLFGSSTNLLTSAAAAEAGAEPLTLFALAPMGAIIALVGGLYVLFVMPWLIPDRYGPLDKGVATGDDSHRAYLVQLPIDQGHPLIGAHINTDGALTELENFTIHAVLHGSKRMVIPPFDGVRLTEGDAVLTSAPRAAILHALRRNPRLAPRALLGDEPDASDLALLEAVVAPGSRLAGHSADAGLAVLHADNPGLACAVLGVERRNRTLRAPIARVTLKPGDVLLLAGRRTRLRVLRGNRNLIPLNLSSALGAGARPRMAALTMGATTLFAALGFATLPVAAILGAFAAIALRLITPAQAVRALDTRLFFLVGSSLILAHALTATGAALWIANLMVAPLTDAPLWAALSGLFLIISILTNFITNNAAAAIAAPIAVAIAESLAAPVMPFVIAAALAASCSFATPTGYQTNLLAMTAGHYRFRDFILAGAPLTLIAWITFTLAAPWVFNLP